MPVSRILLVDDNANGLSARRCVLEELGHRISTASSASEALEQIATTRFDLVVTDFKMPKMDGVELIGRLRKQCPGVPIILLSGFAEGMGLSESNTGADAVIQKSANEVTHLVRSVSRLLRKKKPAGSQGPPPATSRRKSS
jgi:CheY-like chemotaxis protein